MPTSLYAYLAMKRSLIHAFLLLPFLVICLLAGCSKSDKALMGPILEVFPGPGDLSGVEGLEGSTLFAVGVEGQDLFVYRGFELEFNKYGFAQKGGHYTSFAFTRMKPEVRIRTRDPLLDFKIEPEVVGLVRQVSDTEIVLSLDEPQKLVMTAQFEEGEDQWLAVSAEAPASFEIDRDDPSVLVLGPGVHDYGRAWDPFEGGIKTLYLEGGAVVTATLRVVGRDGISILGHGLFSQAFRPHAKQEDPLQTEWMGNCMGAYFRDCKDLRFEGYAVINAPSYQLEVANCENVLIRNVKLLGFGENNNDGIHAYSRNVLIEDSLIAGSDDRICITGLYDSEDREILVKADQQKRITGCDVGPIHIRDVVLWGHRNGADIMLTWNGSHTCEDILIENVKSLVSRKGGSYKGFVGSMHGGSVIVRDVVIRNAEVYHNTFLSLLVNPASVWGAGGGAIRDVLFENIKIHSSREALRHRVRGTSAESKLANFTFRNVTLEDGSLLTGFEGTSIEVGDFVENFVFE